MQGLAGAFRADTLRFATFKVRHVSPDIAVEGIDDHLAIRWAGDLNTSVDKPRRWRSTSPGVIFTNVLGLREEIWKMAPVNLLLTDYSSLQKSFPCAVEGSVEEGEESRSFGSKDLAEGFLDGAINSDAFVDCLDGSHFDDMYLRLLAERIV